MVVTPHVGLGIVEARFGLAACVAASLIAFIAGERLNRLESDLLPAHDRPVPSSTSPKAQAPKAADRPHRHFAHPGFAVT